MLLHGLQEMQRQESRMSRDGEIDRVDLNLKQQADGDSATKASHEFPSTVRSSSDDGKKN